MTTKAIFKAYEGKNPFIFVSYAHADSDKVFKILNKLNENGLRIWFDSGIAFGEEWPTEIAHHIKNSDMILAFISKNSIESTNCRQEITYSLKHKKKILSIILDEVELPEGLDLQISIYQAEMYYRYSDCDTFIEHIKNFEIFDSVKEEKICIDTGPFSNEDGHTGPNGKLPLVILLAALLVVGGIFSFLKIQKKKAVDENAVKWEQETLNDDDGQAMRNLARLYKEGSGVEKSYAKAKELFEAAADQGDLESMKYLGSMYEKGEGLEASIDKAIEWYKKAADEGDLEAQSELKILEIVKEANTFYDSKQYKEALPLYEEAAELGNSTAMSQLSFMYGEAKGVEKDLEVSIQWCRKAAEAGNIRQMWGLGYQYQYGFSGLEKSDEIAVEWYQKAVDAGSVEAMRYLGKMYKYGLGGLEQSDEIALDYFKKSADGGYDYGIYEVGVMYEEGRGGLKQSMEEARKCYERAASTGALSAVEKIGWMYEEGLGGLEKSIEEAKKYYERAASVGSKLAIEALERLQNQQ